MLVVAEVGVGYGAEAAGAVADCGAEG